MTTKCPIGCQTITVTAPRTVVWLPKGRTIKCGFLFLPGKGSRACAQPIHGCRRLLRLLITTWMSVTGNGERLGVLEVSQRRREDLPPRPPAGPTPLAARTRKSRLGVARGRSATCSDDRQPKRGLRSFSSTIAAMSSTEGPFGPGLRPLAEEEKRKEYLR